MLDSLLVILVLIVISFFFAMSEISLAAARKIKLRLLANDGDIRAEHVLKLQESPGMFFTVVQMGQCCGHSRRYCRGFCLYAGIL